MIPRRKAKQWKNLRKRTVISNQRPAASHPHPVIYYLNYALPNMQLF
jgi:hypothetical protein